MCPHAIRSRPDQHRSGTRDELRRRILAQAVSQPGFVHRDLNAALDRPDVAHLAVAERSAKPGFPGFDLLHHVGV
jgi:hypothetical protein